MSDHARRWLGDFIALWCRLYVVCLVLIMLGGVVTVAWLAWSTLGLQNTILSAFALIPLGLGGALAVSLPIALLWMLLARLMGWRAVQTGNVIADKPVCDRCSYDVTGLHPTRCPECGRDLTAESPVA